MIKKLIKRSIQIIAAKFGPHSRPSNKPQLLILMYHRILPLEDDRVIFEEPGMIVSPETFQMNLETISNNFEFVKLTDWIERKKNNLPLPTKACAITFDDGWADNYEYAFPILKKMNIPATIFLVSDMIGSNAMFWPERLARTVYAIALNQPTKWNNPLLSWIKSENTDFSFSNIPPSRDQISQIIAHAKQFSDHDIHKRLDIIENEIDLLLPLKASSLLNWEQVKIMTDSNLIEVGSHTCHHTRLNTELENKITLNEVVNSKIQIEKETCLPVKTFCFPNGDFSPLSLEIVRDNYIGAVTTQSGWNTKNSDNHLLQRVGVHNDVAADKIAFLSRISGWI